MKQNGIASTLLMLIVLALVVLGAVFLFKRTRPVTDFMDTTEVKQNVETTQTFESMGSDEAAPKEIDNSSIDELDQMFVDIEKSAPTDDLSDL